MVIFCFFLVLSSHFRAVRKEYDDLNAKTQEAEKEVKVIQMKIQDTENYLSKLQREMDGNLNFVIPPVFLQYFQGN